MNEFHRQATAHLDASPATTFGVTTGIPTWNAAIEDIIESPNAKTGSHQAASPASTAGVDASCRPLATASRAAQSRQLTEGAGR